MFAIDQLDQRKQELLIAEMLNAEFGFSLIPSDSPSSNAPVLWQGHVNKRYPFVNCEIRLGTDANEAVGDIILDCNTIMNGYQTETFILVLLKAISDADKKRFNQDIKNNNLQKLIIWDLTDVKESLDKYPNIVLNYGIHLDTWIEAYRRIAILLEDFYDGNNERPANSIYNKLQRSEYYSVNSKRIFQYTEESISKGLDPIQIFATFNYSRISIQDRIKNINLLFDAFKYTCRVSENTDFKGIPSPIITSIIHNRKTGVQDEIWKTFHTLFKEKLDGLKEEHFDQLDGWYGIGIPAFTIFLFWIDSEVFLPLDQNTITFIVGMKVTETIPKTYSKYKDLCTRIIQSSPQKHTIRTIVKEAYDFVPSGSGVLSSELIEMLSLINKTDIFIEQESGEILAEFLRQNFKVIALRPHLNINGQKQRHTKNLEANVLYQFYNYYEFLEEDAIKVHESISESLYNDKGEQSISISAIVGKNGSGKSTIAELLYLIINKVSKLAEFPSGKDLKDEPIFADLFFKTDKIYRLTIGDNIQIWDYRYDTIEGVFKVNTAIVKNEADLKAFNFSKFFYTLVLNYSPYGLNSAIIGPWIDPLFDKNDGYQIPIAFNPKRKEGSINIQREETLAKSRLLSNILEPKREEVLLNNRVPELISGKIPGKLTLEIDNEKLKRKRLEFLSTEDLGEIHRDIFNLAFNQLNIGSITAKDGIEELKEYIYYKLISISGYSQFQKYNDLFTQEKPGIFTEKINNFYKDIIEDETHATFKIKQAFNYLKFSHYSLTEGNGVFESIKKIDKIQAEERSKKNRNGKNRLARTIEFVPPSIFKTNILFEDDVISEKNSFNELSSGEKQQILSINTITYHLFNLNSVSDTTGIVKYNSVNILFDEVELCFHPDMQRTYINNLLEGIKRIELGFTRKLNLMFITHSPFILSDIPSSNLLKLTNGKPDPFYQSEQTFAANVHDLLANEFFLDQGFMGEYAKKRINEIVQVLSLTKLKNEYFSISDNANISPEKKENDLTAIKNELLELSRLLSNSNEAFKDVYNEDPRKMHVEIEKYIALIEIIGEPILKTKLLEMYDEAMGYDKNASIKREIERLQKLIN